ncbi:hypothetical protein OAJ74_03010 [Alphaproteobacteria bacterium]|nr:hypothetical protein [Alphaproteobacteria bacterium]
MSLKNINKLLFLSLFLFSCEVTELLNESKIVYSENNEVKEDIAYIELNFTQSLNFEFIDFYSVNKSFKHFSNSEILKIHELKFNKKHNLELKPLTTIVKNDTIYYIDYESNFNVFDLKNFQLINSTNIQSKLIQDYNFPTSLAQFKDYYYTAYNDGKIICFNLNGKIIWENDYADIIKTPLKIHNNSIIVLLSDKIISLNPKTGELLWLQNYYNDNVFQSTGGDIANLNHLLLFILPNNKIGEIDTLFGEKNNSIFSGLKLEDSINNSFDKIYIYKNHVSYFDQKKYLTTINFNESSIILDNSIIENVKSYIFFNNSLITLNKDSLLKSFNIFNGNLFWKINTKDILPKDDRIINIANSSTSLFIFFQSGNILELDQMTGSILSVKKLKLKNISAVYFIDKYILINQQNEKTSIFIQ